jgi:hypothetical protein
MNARADVGASIHDGHMRSTPGPRSAQLADLRRERARAEAAEQTAMLALARELRADAARHESPQRRQIELSAIPLVIGRTLGLSEGQAMVRLANAERVHDRLPTTWLAFAAGRIDADRVREIGRAASRLERDDSFDRLDQRAATYAESHTVPELRSWLKRFVVRVEPDRAAIRAEKERAASRLDVTHDDDAMAWLTAYLPSHVAAAIDERLDRAARAFGSDDPRTLPQRRADLLASWATTSDATEPTLRTDIAVTIDAATLAGATDGFAISADGSWSVPSSWVAELAQTQNPFWHRMVLDPVTDDVLSHEYIGRFAPEILTKALIFRDGTCRGPGCLTPADRCDVDHREPWPDGPTSGVNNWMLCRRNHNQKGHGVLCWVLLDGTIVPVDRPDRSTPRIEVSPGERHLAHTLVDQLDRSA